MKSGVRRVGGPGGLLLCLGLIVAVWLCGGLEQKVALSGYLEIATARSRLDSGRTWVDPRWESELAERLARLGPEDASDAEARARIENTIAALSFVVRTGEAEVLWPDGLRVPVQFQNPVACLPVGELFYAVAADGTILSGSWKTPPRVGPGWLPLIGEVGVHYPDARPGDVLEGDPELDAISIAISMWLHLSPKDLETLGRVVIDATDGRGAGPTRPGARILLEGGREIWFGRPPRCGAPGSLPDKDKWANLTEALAYLRDSDAVGDADSVGNWDWVDLRWDRPEMHLFGSGTAAQDGAAQDGPAQAGEGE